MKNAPYYPGSCEHIFKWKPKLLNSIDFNLIKLPKVVAGFENVWCLKTSDGVLFDFISFTDDEQSLYSKMSESFNTLVLECFFD